LKVLSEASAVRPSDRRPDEFWERFALRIESRIRQDGRTLRQAESSAWGFVRSFFVLHRFQIAGVMALLFLAIVLWNWRDVFKQGEVHIPPDEQPAVFEPPPADRVTQYFRKSKVLLVGLANMKPSGETLDLTVERRASRELIREARYLRQQPLDSRSAHLIDDLQKIMIELANLEETHDAPDVDIIRSGIRRENLLFKIRRAEAVRDPIRVANARYSPDN
jgi:hypothetical protein